MRTPNYKCVVCNKPHYQRPSQIEKSVNGLTCSKECGKINRAKHMVGKDNHQFNVKGEDNASFKGYRKISRYGYVLLYTPEHVRANHAGYVWEHLLIMEKHIHRSLKYFGKQNKNNEVCHHKDRDRQNNSIGNLQLMTLSEHTSLHLKEDKDRAIKAGNTRKSFTKEQVYHIEGAYSAGGITQKEIAEGYGVSQSVISNVINKRRICYGKK